MTREQRPRGAMFRVFLASSLSALHMNVFATSIDFGPEKFFMGDRILCSASRTYNILGEELFNEMRAGDFKKCPQPRLLFARGDEVIFFKREELKEKNPFGGAPISRLKVSLEQQDDQKEIKGEIAAIFPNRNTVAVRTGLKLHVKRIDDLLITKSLYFKEASDLFSANSTVFLLNGGSRRKVKGLFLEKGKLSHFLVDSARPEFSETNDVLVTELENPIPIHWVYNSTIKKGTIRAFAKEYVNDSFSNPNKISVIYEDGDTAQKCYTAADDAIFETDKSKYPATEQLIPGASCITNEGVVGTILGKSYAGHYWWIQADQTETEALKKNNGLIRKYYSDIAILD